MRILQVLER